MTLVETLSAQHQHLAALATRVDEHLAAGDLRRLVETVRELKGALVKHLVLEDQQLYPELVRATDERGDGPAGLRARSFAAEMARVSATLLAFFVRCEGGEGLATLAQAWPTVKALLLERIASEESGLYPMYRHFRPVGSPRADQGSAPT